MSKEADVAEADRRLLRRRRASAEIEIALGVEPWRRAPARPSDVATALSVTPAQATSACSSMSPEQMLTADPPVAGCRPALTSACPVSTEQVTPSPMAPLRVERHHAPLRVLAIARP